MSEALAVREEYRLREWGQLIREHHESGLTAREFCRERGISERSYYYWLRKLRERAAEQQSPELVRLNDERDIGRLRISLNGSELNLPGNIDADLVCALLKSIQSL